MIDLDLLYVMDKSMIARCKKGELVKCDEGISTVTDRTLVNGHAYKARNGIHVYYIATK